MAPITMRSKAKAKVENSDTFRAASQASTDANCIVAKGTRIEGDFSSTESIRLDGIVVGKVKCERRLVIGEDGKIEGKVNTVDAVVMGRIKGDVNVSGTLRLMGTAFIEGDIHAKTLLVEEGASYIGNCHVGGKQGVEGTNSVKR